MPTRPLRPKAVPCVVPKDFTHAIAYHSSAITIFWILFLFLSFGFACLFLVQYAKIEVLMQDAAFLNQQLAKTQRAVINLQKACPAAQPAVTAPTTPPEAAAPVQSGPTYTGILKLGSFSPDGTKYAGYDLDTVGKYGIGVETMADGRLRRVVLLNPKTEFTSQTERVDQPTTVRWKDNSTIEYDILLSGGKREVRTVRIGF